MPAVLLIGGLVLTGCTKATPRAAVSSTHASTSSAPSSSTAPTSASARPTPTRSVAASFGATCDDLLPVTAVDEALGRPVIGKVAFVVGVPEPSIGRLARLNCRYGLAAAVKGKPAPTPKIEIGVSLYNSTARAASRVQATVEDYLSHGARAAQVTVDQYPGTVLTGYGNPTIVTAAGPRTVAVTGATVSVGRSPAAALTSVAALALTATAGFVGGPAVASPSAAPTGSGSPTASASVSAS